MEFHDKRPTYYHGSNAELPDGSWLSAQGPAPHQQVHVTSSRAVARTYGSNLYEVHPSGVLNEDPNEEEAHRVATARVVRRVKFGRAV